MSNTYIYTAVYKHEDNGTISVYFPDIDNCFTMGDTIDECISNAKECLELYIEAELDENNALPKPTNYEAVCGNKFLVVADVENMKKQNRSVNKTVTLPYWLNDAAEKAHINFSGVLQDALKQRLSVSEHERKYKRETTNQQ
ncbi:MAG: type II toxin-antitoxin system HicB family antitoxin [Oscillospiraceae bacterium]|nr:type II toxin-antitoxin system HicB family antitoxin [Oscillospiraceae bacterium]